MTKEIEAIYERGMIRPLQPLELHALTLNQAVVFGSIHCSVPVSGPM